MSYSDFLFADLFRLFGLGLQQKPLFREVPAVDPEPWLLESLQRARLTALPNEKSRSESIVSPILMSCGSYLDDHYSIYSGVSLEIDSAAGLRGECDFILARMPPVPELRAPLMVVVEAKRGEVEAGLAQCAAQMWAARKFNERNGSENPRMYGCCTSGINWRFLRLEASTIVLDQDTYFISEVGKILGILVAIMKGNGNA